MIDALLQLLFVVIVGCTATLLVAFTIGILRDIIDDMR